jgi:predicted NodU family carbamoyl transferase
LTRILGISAVYRDSTAALVADGRIVAAVQEVRPERLSTRRTASACLREVWEK